MARLRLAVFPTHPEFLLIMAEPGCVVDLPTLTSPFDKPGVAAVCGEAGVDVSVSERQMGRYNPTMAQALRDAANERRQRAQLEQVTTAALSRQSFDVQQRDRADLILRKGKIDAEIRDLKVKIGSAKSRAYRGRYTDPGTFRGWEQRLARLQAESLDLQARLGAIKQQRQCTKGDAERFRAAAHNVLDKATLARIYKQMEDGNG